MSDEQPVPETLETIAASIRELRTSMDERFAASSREWRTAMDERFAASSREWRTAIDELRAQLRADTEAVRADIRLIVEAFGTQVTRNKLNDTAHRGFKKQLDNHDTRILALERKDRA